MSPLNLNTVLKPPHVTFDSRGPYHRSSIRSVFDYLGSGELDSVFNQKHHRRHSQGQSVYEEDVVFPNFTVRETAEAYFLEGDFPGIHNPNDIRIERLGSQGLHIEAHVPELDLYHEWGNNFGIWPGRDTRVERGASDTATAVTEGGGHGSGVKPKAVEMRSRSRDRDHEHEHDHGHKHEHNDAGESGKPRSSENDAKPSAKQADPARPNKLHRRESSSYGDMDEQTTTLLLNERHAGRLLRSFSFPQPVDMDRMRARLKDGVLRIALPKASIRERQSSYKIEYGG
ncbi:hypothetical protein FOPE_05958 [Fonsecaea pedrosoi]|nr:hypothetical protein FOPE_05958 [Fonsecaea pedrosoi]